MQHSARPPARPPASTRPAPAPPAQAQARPAPGGGPGTLTVTDSRTGRTYEIPIGPHGTIRALDLKQITAGGDGVGLRTYDNGCAWAGGAGRRALYGGLLAPGFVSVGFLEEAPLLSRSIPCPALPALSLGGQPGW